MSDLNDAKVRYEALKAELVKDLTKKRHIDKQLTQLEVQMYKTENQYLQDTSGHSGGNIVHGFDNYLKNQTVGRRKYEVSDQDRVFSNSSLTCYKALEAEGEDISGHDDYKLSTPGLISVPPASKHQELSLAQQNKLVRDKEYQRRKRAAERTGNSVAASDDEPRSSKKARTSDVM